VRCSVHSYGDHRVLPPFPTRRSSDLRRAVEIDSTSASALEAMGWIEFKQGSAEDAVRWLTRAAELEDASARVFEHLGDVHEALRSEEHTSELQSRENLVCRLLLEKKK